MAGIHHLLAAGAAGAFAFDQTISANTSNYNLYNAAIAAGWNGITPLAAVVTINSGVVVSASSTSNYAFDTGTSPYPVGSSLTLNTTGAYIIGMGGYGGLGGRGYTTVGGAGYAGGPGGPAARINLPTTWDNTGGTLGGGGGGGGGGQGKYYSSKAGVDAIGGGGGGGGRTGSTASSAGPGGNASGGGVSFSYTGNPGGAGSFSSAGSGGAGRSGSAGSPSGAGGNGGTWGSAGGSGGTGSTFSTTVEGPFAGGAGGTAIVGDSNVTWVNTGTRLGAIS